MASLGAVACATGGAGDDTTADAQPSPDATADARSGDGGSCPSGTTGPGCTQCASGFHLCGTSCQQDHANTPDVGCTQGCGSACTAPTNATAKCTSGGTCDFACETTFDKVDGGCVCPQGQVVCNGNTCAQCCVDSDCVGNQLCTNGVCGGCQPGYGDCNNNPSDGCETHLNSTSNCGSCGHSCCGSFCGCGFLGFGGESCNASGSSFSCGC